MVPGGRGDQTIEERGIGSPKRGTKREAGGWGRKRKKTGAEPGSVPKGIQGGTVAHKPVFLTLKPRGKKGRGKQGASQKKKKKKERTRDLILKTQLGGTPRRVLVRARLELSN